MIRLLCTIIVTFKASLEVEMLSVQDGYVGMQHLDSRRHKEGSQKCGVCTAAFGKDHGVSVPVYHCELSFLWTIALDPDLAAGKFDAKGSLTRFPDRFLHSIKLTDFQIISYRSLIDGFFERGVLRIYPIFFSSLIGSCAADLVPWRTKLRVFGKLPAGYKMKAIGELVHLRNPEKLIAGAVVDPDVMGPNILYKLLLDHVSPANLPKSIVQSNEVVNLDSQDNAAVRTSNSAWRVLADAKFDTASHSNQLLPHPTFLRTIF